MKINKNPLAREMGLDRRTMDKYLNGFTPKKTKEKISILDEYYEVIAALLSEYSKQVFYYRRILWQYLKDNHGLECATSTFRRYIAKTPEFTAYFTDQVRIPSPKGTSRFETLPGQQVQFDWKESIPFKTSDGENIEVNVGALVLQNICPLKTVLFNNLKCLCYGGIHPLAFECRIFLLGIPLQCFECTAVVIGKSHTTRTVKLFADKVIRAKDLFEATDVFKI